MILPKETNTMLKDFQINIKGKVKILSLERMERNCRKSKSKKQNGYSILTYLRTRQMSKQSSKQFDQLQRIRMLETRMRNKEKLNHNEQSVRSIKSTDSKKLPQFKEQAMILGNKNEPIEVIEVVNSEDEIQLEVEIKNNRKITDYFAIKTVAKKQDRGSQYKQENRERKSSNIQPNIQQSNSNNSKSNMTIQEEAIREENRTLKQKLKIKDQSFNTFRTKIKNEMLGAVVSIHQMKRNQMRLRVSNNKIRLGEYQIQKKGSDFWIDGSEIRDIKQKLELINRQKQELEKNKKLQGKKTNKQPFEDPDEWKYTIASQLHFLTREETHLQETLKRLEQQKILHIKQYKLMYDEEHSKYGKIDPKIGTTLWPKIGQYQLLSLLGKGGFSEVYKAFDTEELRQVACKLHQLSPQWNATVKQNFIKHAVREQEVHKMLNHPNIVKLFGTVEIDQNAFCTILEFCEGPDLSYYLKKHKRLPEKQAKMVIKQVINAIKYLHELPEKVIHYDLKPQNIMFHKGKIKITDFGLCKTTNEQIIELTSQGVGTYWYLPPECFVTDQKAMITPKVDIWSIGVIYFEMLYGQKPFGNQMSQMRILNESIMLKATTVNFPNYPKCIVSTQSKDFIKACLKANVDQRLNIKQVFTHPLFEKR